MFNLRSLSERRIKKIYRKVIMQFYFIINLYNKFSSYFQLRFIKLIFVDGYCILKVGIYYGCYTKCLIYNVRYCNYLMFLFFIKIFQMILFFFIIVKKLIRVEISVGRGYGVLDQIIKL